MILYSLSIHSFPTSCNHLVSIMMTITSHAQLVHPAKVQVAAGICSCVAFPAFAAHIPHAFITQCAARPNNMAAVQMAPALGRRGCSGSGAHAHRRQVTTRAMGQQVDCYVCTCVYLCIFNTLKRLLVLLLSNCRVPMPSCTARQRRCGGDRGKLGDPCH